MRGQVGAPRVCSRKGQWQSILRRRLCEEQGRRGQFPIRVLSRAPYCPRLATHRHGIIKRGVAGRRNRHRVRRAQLLSMWSLRAGNGFDGWGCSTKSPHPGRLTILLRYIAGEGSGWSPALVLPLPLHCSTSFRRHNAILACYPTLLCTSIRV